MNWKTIYFILFFALFFLPSITATAQISSNHIGKHKKPTLIIEEEDGAAPEVFIEMDVPMVDYVTKITVFTKHSRKGVKRYDIHSSGSYYSAVDGRIHIKIPLGGMDRFEGKGHNTVVKLSIVLYNHSGQKIYQQDKSDDLATVFSQYFQKKFNVNS